MKKISIVVPAKNEERGIKKFLTELTKEFSDSEIIVVCNGCTDRTPSIVKQMTQKNLRMIDISENIGKGAAILEGFSVAKNDLIGFVDADGAFTASAIKKIVSEIGTSDCVIASKWKGREIFSVEELPLNRKIYSKIWNQLVKAILDLNFSDTQAGLKFLKREAFEAIDQNFLCRGYDFDIELLYKLQKNGFKIKEVSMPFRVVKKDRSLTVTDVSKMFYNLIKLRWSI